MTTTRRAGEGTVIADMSSRIRTSHPRVAMGSQAVDEGGVAATETGGFRG